MTRTSHTRMNTHVTRRPTKVARVGVVHTQRGLFHTRTGAREHFILADHMVRVAAGADVESLLAARLDHVLVAGHACGFEGLTRDLKPQETRHKGKSRGKREKTGEVSTRKNAMRPRICLKNKAPS